MESCVCVCVCVCVCSQRCVFSPSEFVVDCRKFVDSNALGLTVAALSSYDPHMRAAAYAVLAAYYSQLEGARFREQPQVSGAERAWREDFLKNSEALPRDSDTEPKSCLLLAGRGEMPQVILGPQPWVVDRGLPLQELFLCHGGQSSAHFCRLVS